MTSVSLMILLLELQVQFGWNVHVTTSIGSGSSTSSDGPNYSQMSNMQTEKVARRLMDSMPVESVPGRPCKRGEDLPKLVLVQQWNSKKQRPRESITLMTQLSADR